MNLGDTSLRSVHYNNPELNHFTSQHSIEVSNGEASQSEADYAADIESITTADTRVPWTAELQSAHCSLENTQSDATVRSNYFSKNINANATTITMAMRADEGRTRPTETAASKGLVLDDLDSAPPTPDTDDTPYIRFAIDQITRDDHVPKSQRPTTATSEDSYPVDRIIPDQGLGYVQSVKKVKGPSLIQMGPKTPKLEMFIPIEPQLDSPRYPDLTFMPMRLRPFSMIMIILLCLLMIIALIFCAIYSMNHVGLVVYADGLYSAQYFLFQFLPQILASTILLYIESVMSTVSRVVPFTMMASDDTRRRSNALFVGLYPSSLFWPRFDYFSAGEKFLGICSILLWPMIFTIPLQSSLFSVILVDGNWRWTAVKGVVWTLITIYLLAFFSLVGITLYFFRKFTGLIWDPRSLADIIALLPRSNILDEYQDTEVLPSKRELRQRLAVTSERLGYWRTNNALQEIFYCIGEEGAPTRRYKIRDGRTEKRRYSNIYDEKSDLEAAASPHPLLRDRLSTSTIEEYDNQDVRFRHLPWFLQDTFVLLWPIAAFFFVLAIMIVSFLPNTALGKGFLPLVPAGPDSAGFSSANFLYSFVPSFIGLLVYYSLRYISLALCRLAPWAALSNPDGAIASESILLDYAASVPILNALSNNHYLVAYYAIITPVTILLPILAGGLFFPIEFLPSNTVFMLPNLPAFYIILVILILDVIGLISVAASFLRKTGRNRYRLPHPVSCLAEIISFVYASQLIHDAAFRSVRGKADLSSRLVGRRERNNGPFGGQEVRYYFGPFRGRDGRSHIGIDRWKKEEWWKERMGNGRKGYGRNRN